jgi:hypothetical protein
VQAFWFLEPEESMAGDDDELRRERMRYRKRWEEFTIAHLGGRPGIKMTLGCPSTVAEIRAGIASLDELEKDPTELKTIKDSYRPERAAVKRGPG